VKPIVLRRAWRAQWFQVFCVFLGLWMFFVPETFSALVSPVVEMFERHVFGYRIDTTQVVKLLGLIIAAVYLLKLVFFRYRDKYIVDQKGVEHVRGILGREARPLSYRSINFATKKQSILGKIFNIGDISLHSAGTDRADVVIQCISSPRKIMEVIQTEIESVRVVETDRVGV